MSWSYNANMDEPRDRLRLEIGDTSSSAPLLDDEVLDFALSTFGDNVERAAIKCLDYLIAGEAKVASYSVDGLSVQASEIGKNYHALRKSLLERVSGEFELWPGHTSQAVVEVLDADPDRPEFAFNRKMLDYPEGV